MIVPLSLIAVAMVSASRDFAEKVLRSVEDESSGLLGPMLIRADLEWL